ncbi:tetratricopeptide repeat protein [candidate division KSB1 bacterium]|nr:tetratricopeptide repeat protein [candidate division KSB1 bacterium]NIR71549.1 tetratricopeptide repeat protein [candidate division KSB1 bacterium]NIS26345.1 tetratricopeptide repeat protein [candidate division KSB1 bacterium]NIT73112.1 tetratricopeptide repeat protein [candidate division KSB1 bacterium]NIU27028.1 tetratricopeptide repeat protein [candidate division KSB1 bacterium]
MEIWQVISIPVLLIPYLAFGQTSEEQLLQEIRKAYQELNYAEAEIKATTALDQYQRFTPVHLTEIHKILGIIYYSQNKPEQARVHFQNALSLTPTLTLDPLYVSPKILDFFKKVKARHAEDGRDTDEVRTNVRYVLVEDPRPAAAIRSMLLPGWGQLYKGETTKGRVLIALWGVGVIGSVTAHFKREQAQDSYLSETDPQRIESRFNTFDSFHKLRNNLLLFSAGVWLYSYLDAILKERPHQFEQSQRIDQSLLVAPCITPESARLILSVNF